MKPRPMATDEVQYYDWRLARWNMSETRERLDATGRGIYRELMDVCYGQGAFPDDASWISRKCACSVRDYQKWWPVIERHFPKLKSREGYRHNIIADIWRKNYFSLCKSNRKNGKAGGVKSGETKRIGSGRLAVAGRPLDPSLSEPSSLKKERKKEETSSDPVMMPLVSDFPETDRAVRTRYGSADLKIITRIIHGAAQAFVSADRPKIPPLTDADIAAAVAQAAKENPRQDSPALFLTTVPAVVKSWCQIGRHPPGGEPAQRPLKLYVKPTAPANSDERPSAI